MLCLRLVSGYERLKAKVSKPALSPAPLIDWMMPFQLPTSKVHSTLCPSILTASLFFHINCLSYTSSSLNPLLAVSFSLNTSVSPFWAIHRCAQESLLSYEMMVFFYSFLFFSFKNAQGSIDRALWTLCGTRHSKLVSPCVQCSVILNPVQSKVPWFSLSLLPTCEKFSKCEVLTSETHWKRCWSSGIDQGPKPSPLTSSMYFILGSQQIGLRSYIWLQSGFIIGRFRGHYGVQWIECGSASYRAMSFPTVLSNGDPR